MNAIEAFLKAIPLAAQSPLAFVAYVIVVAAWITRTWLKGKPAADALKILTLYQNDADRNTALAKLVGQPPPEGLKGNDAILAWVRINSTDKSRVLLVFAWIATLTAVLAFAVAVKNAKDDIQKPISILLHRSGTTDDCPSIPLPAKLDILDQSGGIYVADVPMGGGCKASVMVPPSAQKNWATIVLKDATPYVLSNPSEKYQLGASQWEIIISEAAPGTHLRISLFSYGGQCAHGDSAFNTFKEILKSKASSLRLMFPAEDSRYNYLSNIFVNATGKQLDMSVSGVHAYWEQTGSLQVLSGLCFQQGGSEVMNSQIYFGSLAGGAPEPFLAEFPISVDEFGTTRDIHTAAILYSLGEEAASRHLDRELVAHYLGTARDIAMQIRVGPARMQLLQAIEQSLRDAGVPVAQTM